MRVLVLDEGFLGSVYTADGLRAAGCDVVLAAAVGGRHQYVGRGLRAHLLPTPGHTAFLPALRQLLSNHPCDVVLPCTEPLLRLDGNAHGGLPRIFPALTCAQRALIASKRAMSEFMAQHRIPVPRSIAKQSTRSLPDAVAALGLPVIVKGAYGRGGDAVRLARTLEEAHAAWQAIQAARGEAFLETYLRGPTFLVGGLFTSGRALRLHATEKLEQHPRLTGPSIRVRTVDDPVLLELGTRVFQALQWNGLGSADFIRTADGHYHFLEVNPRPWGSIAAAQHADVDLFAPLRDLLAGAQPDADLRFTAQRESRVLPVYLLASRYRYNPLTLLHLVRDLAAPQGRIWREPGFAVHLLHRLERARRNWEQL
jgi:carbamoyl-phosphate synthase L subunit-like protein